MLKGEPLIGTSKLKLQHVVMQCSVIVLELASNSKSTTNIIKPCSVLMETSRWEKFLLKCVMKEDNGSDSMRMLTLKITL